MTDPIRVFVGTSANGDDAEAEMVLEYSIQRNTKRPVEINWMRPSRDLDLIWGGWDMSRWATPFSGFRWSVPEACGFKGRAIYTDADVLFLRDLEALWSLPMDEGTCVAFRGMGRFCVALWDCEAAREYLPSVWDMKGDPLAHGMMTARFAKSDHSTLFSEPWNCLDGEDLALDNIAGLHLTDMSSNPAFVLARDRLAWEGRPHWCDAPIKPHRRQDVVDLFMRYYIEALQSGMRTADYTPAEKFGEYQKARLTNWVSRDRL